MSIRMGAEKSSFTLTCSLLSQYLKEKGSLADLSLGLICPSESKAKHETPRTMNLLPGLESSGETTKNKAAAAADAAPPAAQMTIFYGGRVVVLDNFPAEKAKELFAMVGRGSSASPSSISGSGTASAGGSTTTAQPQKPLPALPSASDLPIARRVSLNRFLEKRKDRITSKAPYQLHASSDVAPTSSSFASRKVEEKQPWLGLAPSKIEETL